MINAIPWSEVPEEQKLAGYWYALPEIGKAFDNASYEIVYLMFDGRWTVCRIGRQCGWGVDQFRFIKRIVGFPL